MGNREPIEKSLPIAKVFVALLFFPPIFFPMSNSFTQTENHENLAADAGQWEAEQAMLADAAWEQAREEGAEAMREARGNDGVGIFPRAEYGSLESRESAWAHYILTGGE